MRSLRMKIEKGSLLDYRQLSKQLSVSESHLRRLVMRRMIPFIKIGRLVRFRAEDIAAWLEERHRR
jgi:excisionase family DNA binding protein